MQQRMTRTAALGGGMLALAVGVLAILAFGAFGSHTSGTVPLALALGTPTPGGPSIVTGVSCTDVWLDELQAPVANPTPHAVGDPPLSATLDVAISLSRTTHDPSAPMATNITSSVGVTYNGGIPGVIAGALPLGSVPQCSKVNTSALDTVASVSAEPPNAIVVTTNSGTVTNNEMVYWNSSTVARAGFYKVTSVAGSTVNMKKTGAKCSATPAAGTALASLWACTTTNNNPGLPGVYGYETTDVTNNGLEGNPPRSTSGSYDDTTKILTYTTCTASDAVVEGANENEWTRTTITTKISPESMSDASVPSYGLAELFNPTNPKTCTDIAGQTLRSTNVIVSWSVDSVAREGDTSKWTHDYDGDGCPDWQELDVAPTNHGSSPTFTGGRDPFNPYDCAHTPPALQGIWGIDLSAAPVTLDGSNNRIPGIFYRCRAAVLQTGTVLSVPIYCYTDAVIGGSPVVVNPAAAGGNTFCPPAGAALCGDGLGGSTYPAGSSGKPPFDWPAPAGPGCTVGSITLTACPEGTSGGGTAAQCDDMTDNDLDGVINDGCPSKLYGQVDPAHNILLGSYNDVTDRISFEGCYGNVAGAQGPNVYIRTTNVDPVTGHGTVAVWLAQATCAKPGGAPTYAAANLQMVHLGQVGATQGQGYDGDLDGCADYVIDADATMAGNQPGGELGTVRPLGGIRDPFNRWDYPDMPIVSNPRKIRVDDVTYVVNRYRHDLNQTPAPVNPYEAHADHVVVQGSNIWNLGPGNGQIRVDDVTAVVNQYRNDCGL